MSLLPAEAIHEREVRSEGISLTEIYEIFVRRRKIIASILILSMTVGSYLCLQPKHYEATGSVRIQPGMGDMYRTSPISMLSGEASDKIASEVTVIQSRTLYLQVISSLGLVNNPEFWGKKKLKKRMSLDDPLTRQQAVRMLRSELEVSHNPKDEIISLSCKTISPSLSAKIINTVINDYVEYLFKMRYGASERASGWLINQLDDLKKQIESDQTELTRLQQKLGVIGISDKDPNYLVAESLNELTKASSQATIERIIAEAKLRRLEGSDPNLLEGEVNPLTTTGSPQQQSLLQNLRSNQAQLSAAYARLLEQFGPNYPEVKESKAQLDAIDLQVKVEEKRIVNQANLAYSSASSNERMTNEVLAKERASAFNSSSDMVKYIILMHDYESHRSLYEGLVLRLREAGITSGMEAGDVDIVDLADVPAIPARPTTIDILGGAFVLGIVLGLIGASLVEAAERRVTTVEDAERATKMPLLALLPHLERKDGAARQAANENGEIAPPNSLYAEAVQSLRTSILLSQAGSKPRTILVTSTIPGEGKSTIAMNMAGVFASHHARVLLVDCDLRRGSLAKRLGLPRNKGISTVLTGDSTFEESISPVPGFESLFLLGGGPHPPNPATLVDSPEMKQLMQRCRSEFDFVILDCPPLLGISDALNLEVFADVSILVVRSEVTSKKSLLHVRRLMQTSGINLLGYVFNDVKLLGMVYGYGRGYKAYYNWYFDSGNEGAN